MTKEQYSPITQAVKDAVLNLYKNDEVIRDSAWGLEKDTVVVALRALVKQNTKEYLVIEKNLERHCEYQTYIDVVCVDDILTIIKELEETK
jgi:polysaccharide pyruvyl transferase WcaK-like protein